MDNMNTGPMNTGPLREDRPDTLERLLSLCAKRSPQKTALCDPPNRSNLERNPEQLMPRQYTYEELDRTVSRLAAHFASLGLSPWDYVAVQTAHFSETPLLVLALMRAGLVPCLLPLSWSIGEISLSFQCLKPAALISCGQMEEVNHSQMMRELAFSSLHVRFVMGVGHNVAEGVSDISALFDPARTDRADFSSQHTPNLADLALVTYIDPSTPVPHTNGQILATGLQHVLELELSENDHILSPYPLSSIPGLAACFYPWLMAGCCLSLHHPFQFNALQEQLQKTSFSLFPAPEQVMRWLLQSHLPVPQKLAVVRRDSALPIQELHRLPSLDLYDLWNLGGLGSVIGKYTGEPDSSGLFPAGRLCLPPDDQAKLCLAAGRIIDDRLHVKGRIFPRPDKLPSSQEWLALKQRRHDDWLDTGLAATAGADDSIVLNGNGLLPHMQKAAS